MIDACLIWRNLRSSITECMGRSGGFDWGCIEHRAACPSPNRPPRRLFATAHIEGIRHYCLPRGPTFSSTYSYTGMPVIPSSFLLIFLFSRDFHPLKKVP